MSVSATIHVDPDTCVLCGLCTGVCPPNALELAPTQLRVLANCTGCGWCIPYCPVGALSGGRGRPPRRGRRG
ncbi:MAG: 4Fe-4S binding protein [Thermoplasmata archaeon]|nr:4Fe-4S binding protein [Thermoplasmata archaeon]